MTTDPRDADSRSADSTDAGMIEVVVGTVGRAHGVRGDVQIELSTDEPDRRFAPGALLRVEGTPRVLTIERARWHSGRLLVTFDGVHDRTAAEAERGAVLVVDVSATEVPDDPDEFYDRQLVGLEVRRVDGSVVGRVSEVVHGGAQDLLLVDVDGAQRLVPFVSALVPTVEVTGGFVVVAEVPGLLEDLDDE